MNLKPFKCFSLILTSFSAKGSLRAAVLFGKPLEIASLSLAMTMFHNFSENKKGMVSSGLYYEGSGKPATLSATGIVSQKLNKTAGKCPTTHTRSV